MHGANRLGANSLLDLVVFGRQADFLEHSWHSGIATVTPIRMEHDGTVIYHELIRIFSEVSIPIANNISIYIIINIYFIQLYIYIYRYDVFSSQDLASHTVDRRNPASAWMVETLEIMGSTTYQLLWDFFHRSG